MQKVQYEIIKNENVELKKIANYINSLEYDYITSRVIEISHYNVTHPQFLIGIGSNQGIKEGFAVVDSAGIIGRVSNIRSESANIIPITHSASKIPVVLIPSGIRAIAEGGSRNNKNLLQLHYIEGAETVPDNEIVITSHLESLIPFGINVGRVLNIESKPHVKIASDISRIGIVSIIKID